MSIEIKMPANIEKVNTNDLGELIWWSAHLGTGPEKLLSIINKIGNSAADIREYTFKKVEEPIK